MELKQLVLASAAVLSAGAYAAGDYSSPPPRPSRQSESALPSGPQRADPAQAQSPQVVRRVQRELKQKGFDAGPVDGQWGPLTERGVKRFQESNNIRASGQLDERTLSALGVQEQSSATGSSKAGNPPGSR